MLKKVQKSDLFFIGGMVVILIMHFACIYGPDHFADESFYPTIPLRLINGDSLVSDEWHLTQFSSLFLYLPVRLWLAIKGSTEGIILFLRFFYLVIHTLASIGIYTFFRKYKIWAIAGALMFYSQVPLRFLSANYHSLLALFLLIMTISLLAICENDNRVFYIIAGFCYGCCCICNPFQCILYFSYVLFCLIWNIQEKIYRKNNVNLINKKRELQNKFFSKDAFLKFSLGLIIAAVISIVFFLVTGGTFSEVIKNIPNLLTDSGHDIFASPLDAFIEKITRTIKHINSISFNLPFILPLFFFILLIDKKRKNINHKTVYIIISLALVIFFTIGVLLGALKSSRCLAMSLPFAIISTVCYILTEKKNKKLFYCMWLPGAIGTIVQYLASDMHLSVMWVLNISNIAGVFFIKEFLAEFISSQEKTAEKKHQNLHKTCQAILCFSICLQLLFHCCIYMIGRTVDNDYVKLNRGPYSGLYLKQVNYNHSNAIMNDLDIIKQISSPDDPVLIISEFSWMFLYVERPFATYSAWQPYLEADRLKIYYENNPEKIPKYIYIGYAIIPSSVLDGYGYSPTRAQNYSDILKQMLNCEEEKLSNGILLTVKN